MTAAAGRCGVEEALARPEAVDAAFGAAEPPESGPIDRAVALLENTIRHSSVESSPPAWTVTAWLAWWVGDGARCDLLLAEAERVDPGYRLAVLLRRMLDARIPPGWVRGVEEGERQP
ncbi:DUF4192 family protein [Pseudactinotalea sp. HY158]|nr:DUF4192 family protein [Pseudactinotalea sp. HY158]